MVVHTHINRVILYTFISTAVLLYYILYTTDYGKLVNGQETVDRGGTACYYGI